MAKNEEKLKTRIWVTPNHGSDCGCSDEEDSVMLLNFEVPGAKKDEIHLHVVKESLRLVAPRDDDSEYVSHYHFACPADISATKAKYEDGILHVEIPYTCPNPYREVDPIKID